MSFFVGMSDSVSGILFHLTEGGHALRRKADGKWELLKSLGENHSIHILVDAFSTTLKVSSSQKVWLNGEPFSSTVLNNNDVIETEGDVFRFVQDEKSIVELNDGSIILCDTDRFIIEQKTSGDLIPPRPSVSETIQFSKPFIHALFACSDIRGLTDAIKTHLLTHFPDSRLLLFFWNETRGCFEKAFQHCGSSRKPFQISSTLFSSVLFEKKAILSQDILKDERFKEAQSLQGQAIHSIMCAPLLWGASISGFVYMDYCDPGKEFSKADFEILLQFLSPAALAAYNLFVRERLVQENKSLKAVLHEERPFIGKSEPVQKLMQSVLKVAKTDLTVLIRGETGTGKEVIAHRIHEYSPRNKYPLTTIHCAMLSENLLESELFGHEKGAFTGANQTKIGKMEQSGGTLFLDEIGEISLNVQVKLLRFLQEKEFERVGGNKKIKVDIRIIAATNRDLEKAVKEGLFREDLYYRLKGVQIRLPSLRERKKDLPELIDYFVQKYCIENNVLLPQISEEALCLLNSYDWPGNVRELKHALEQALVLCRNSRLELNDFDLDQRAIENGSIQPGDPEGLLTFKNASSQFEKKYFMELIRQTQGNISKASRLSGLDRSYLHLKLKKLRINSSQFR